MEINIFCGHLSGYVGAHYLNLPTKTQEERRRSVFIDFYDAFSTVPKDLTQFLESEAEAEAAQVNENENRNSENSDYDEDENDDYDEEDSGWGRRRHRQSRDKESKEKANDDDDFMELYKSMLAQDMEKKASSPKGNPRPLGAWSGKVTPIIQPQVKRKFDSGSPVARLQELERKKKKKQLREYVARAVGIDASTPAGLDTLRRLFNDSDMDVEDNTPSGEWDLESWGDIIASPLHPRSLCPVVSTTATTNTGSTNSLANGGGLARWGDAEGTILSTVRDEGAECIRYFAEECDRVSALKLVVDAQNAWAHAGQVVLEGLREEFPKASVLCVPTHRCTTATQSLSSSSSLSSSLTASTQQRLEAAGISVCAALCAKSLAPLASLTLPIASPFPLSALFTEHPEERLSYDGSPLAFTLDAFTSSSSSTTDVSLSEAISLLSPVPTPVNAAVAELCVGHSVGDLRALRTSVPLTPFARSPGSGACAYALLQASRGAPGELLRPSRAWNPLRTLPTPGAGTKDPLAPVLYFPSRMYAEAFPGCGIPLGAPARTVATAGVFHSSFEVFRYFDGLARSVRDGVPRECLQTLLDDSTGSRMEIADELSQIADDYNRK